MELVRHAQRRGLAVRVADGDPYELNCSLPLFVSRVAGPDNVGSSIDALLALTAFLPGCAYLYLPILLDYIPEHFWRPPSPGESGSEVPAAGSDAVLRAPNRAPIDARFVPQPSVAIRRRKLLEDFLQLRAEWDTDFGQNESFSASASDNGILEVRNVRRGVSLWINFSHRALSLPPNTSRRSATGGNRDSRVINPLGFVVVRS
jgi:hypothetical protein